MPATNRRSKEENLARIRRNQQNCRARKRSQIAELEQQIRELEYRLQGRESSPTSSDRISDGQFREVRRENAALRRLLTAVGIDERSQKQFLESSEKRDAVESIVQGEEVRRTLASSPSQSSEDQQRSTQPSLPPAAEIAFTKVPLDLDMLGEDDEFTDLAAYAGSPEVEGSVAVALHSDVDIDRQTGWTVSITPSQQEIDRRMPISSFAITPTQNILPSGDTRTSCCSTAAMLPSSGAEATTSCSIALSIVSNNNKKQLTESELNAMLRSGFRKDSEFSGDCRVDNRVLFKVLAEICA